MKTNAKRVYRTQAQVTKILEELDSLDISIAEFCRTRNLTAASVYRWKGARTKPIPRFIEVAVPRAPLIQRTEVVARIVDGKGVVIEILCASLAGKIIAGAIASKGVQ